MRKYLTFKNGFIFVCILLVLQTCSASKNKRTNYTYKYEIEGKNIIIDSLQKELDLKTASFDTLNVENRALKESISEMKGNYNFLVRSNADQARTIRRQSENIKHE